ncbi:hypothetical protein VTO73DRAFT_14180 [Trametes versicolor]
MAVYVSFNKFLSTFFPSPGKENLGEPERRLHLSHKAVQPLGDSKDEHELAATFAQLVNTSTKHGATLCPGFTVALGKSAWDPNTDGPPKVDGALYPADDTPSDGRPHWEKQRLLIDFTVGGPAADPFDDEDWSAAARKRADRYIAHALAHQQRIALYTLLVNGPNIRLARWDRSGAIYTEIIDYVENPAALRDVLWAFSRLSREGHGLDPTATPLSREDEEYQLMDEFARPRETDLAEEEGTEVQIPKANKKAPRVFAYVRRMFAESLRDGGPRYELLVPKKNSRDAHAFLVGTPTYIAPGAIGRATRGYIALDLEGGRFVFLKDTWLPQCEDTLDQMLEGKALKKLNKAEVKNVPTLVAHGELGQLTQTAYYWGGRDGRPKIQRAYASCTEGLTGRPASVATSRSYGTSYSARSGGSGARPASLRGYRHYRLVVEEVCMPLHSFGTGKQLLSVVKDCVDAHCEAYKTRSRILHCDIGNGNILILPTLFKVKSGEYTVKWKGVLTDWELAKCMPYIGGELPSPRRRRPSVTGSWHSFAAAHALDNPYALAQVDNELESFLHVLHYNGLRYLRHECTDVPLTIAAHFGEQILEDGGAQDEHAQFPYTLPRCQPLKRQSMREGVLHVANPPRWDKGMPSGGPELRAAQEAQGAYEFYVVDKDGFSNMHPLNKVLRTAMRWVSARYQADEERILPLLRAPYARAMETHEPLRELMDEALAKQWPDDDRVGDQLEQERLILEGEDNSLMGAESQAQTSAVETVADLWLIQEEERTEMRVQEREKSVSEEPPSKRFKRDEPVVRRPSVFPSFMRGLGLSRQRGLLRA